MKKTMTIWAVLIVLISSTIAVYATELKVGEKAPNLSLKDSQGNVFTLDSPEFRGKVLSVFYINPDARDLNRHVENALIKDNELDRQTSYKSFNITNLKAGRLPNFVYKSVIKNQREKTGDVILLDYDYTVSNLWGLKKHSDVVVLDKERICRYVYNGKLPPAEVEKLIKVIKEYQVK
jgi:predicted transcriptional regulator